MDGQGEARTCEDQPHKHGDINVDGTTEGIICDELQDIALGRGMSRNGRIMASRSGEQRSAPY